MARSFLILHGYQGSGPAHWQTWLAGRLRAAGELVAYPDLPEPSWPRPEAWRDTLARALGALPSEATVVAHSLACALWLHHCSAPVLPGARAARVLLAAPASAPARRRRSSPSSPTGRARSRARGWRPGSGR